MAQLISIQQHTFGGGHRICSVWYGMLVVLLLLLLFVCFFVRRGRLDCCFMSSWCFRFVFVFTVTDGQLTMIVGRYFEVVGSEVPTAHFLFVFIIALVKQSR